MAANKVIEATVSKGQTTTGVADPNRRYSHTDLTNKDEKNQHPITAITDLDDALKRITSDISFNSKRSTEMSKTFNEFKEAVLKMIEQESARAENTEKILTKKIADTSDTSKDNKKEIIEETATREEADEKLKADIDTKQDILSTDGTLSISEGNVISLASDIIFDGGEIS